MTVSPNGFWHLSLPHSLYLGGTNNIQYLPYNLKERGSFVGCIQKVQLSDFIIVIWCDMRQSDTCEVHKLSKAKRYRVLVHIHSRYMVDASDDKWMRSTCFLIKTIQIAHLIVQWKRTAIIRTFINSFEYEQRERTRTSEWNKSYRQKTLTESHLTLPCTNT